MKIPGTCLFAAILFITFTKLFASPHKSQKVSKTFTSAISFLSADLKYNEKQGIKICEIQAGCNSVFGGDELYEEEDFGAKAVVDCLSQYQENLWFINNAVVDRVIKKHFVKKGWASVRDIKQLLNDPLFLEKASMPVHDPYSLHHFHGILYAGGPTRVLAEKFNHDYPGIIILDAPLFPYWQDKYKMSLLFLKNEKLKKFKPRWNLYKQEYSEELVKSIISDIKSDIFVIKPRGAFKGDGVIIVNKEDLPKTLQYIFGEKEKLKKDRDRSYRHWARDPFDTFIVEEFVSSDPIPILGLDDRLYDPTLRLYFFLIYHQKEIQVVFLDIHWNFPQKPLSENGSLNDMSRSIGMLLKCHIEPDVWDKVEKQFREALTLLYQQMLGID